MSHCFENNTCGFCTTRFEMYQVPRGNLLIKIVILYHPRYHSTFINVSWDGRFIFISFNIKLFYVGKI
jgi:hypothetical protein